MNQGQQLQNAQETIMKQLALVNKYDESISCVTLDLKVQKAQVNNRLKQLVSQLEGLERQAGVGEPMLGGDVLLRQKAE